MFSFHPVIQNWFSEKYGEPTEIQALSWPRIAAREHLLITAPTGSGKTLTAFLWAINQFISGELATGSTRVLYISPLKALNNDIQRNLIEPLEELKSRFEAATIPFPSVNVATRSGDTDSQLRRRMLRHPPEILITTPESLNILLTSKGGQNLLYDIDTIILDEIHGVIDSKRGVLLMSAVERVVPMSGEFQRIALSATVNPLERVAAFVAGYERTNNEYAPRQVGIIQSHSEKKYEISIRYPEAAATRGEDEKVWDFLADDLLQRIHTNNSTLIFVNSRALCEKLTFKINNAAKRIVAYAHHGSLSREIRAEVESRLKQGQLEAIVATSSLEMGIDIGALDEVILVQSPDSISSAIQRIGRAGHQVGAPSRCTIYPTHPRDFLEAAVLSSAVIEKDLEPVNTVNEPLDVLGQIIVSMTGTNTWDIDELFMEIRRSTPYHGLSRNLFDLVLNMLIGRYADHHIRELKPRVRIDRLTNTIEAKRGALLSLYLSGGVIPDRGYFQLRHENGNERIGELDEEFVWEASVGQVFSLGTQVWQVRKITHNDVIVGPAKPTSGSPPFWKSEPRSRSFHFSERIGQFLEMANDQLDDDEFKNTLTEKYFTEDRVADEIIAFLKRQKAHCNADLPHRRHLLFEKINSGPARAAAKQIVMHTGWGAKVNRPLAMALEAGWQKAYGEKPEIYVANESIVVQLPHDLTAVELLQLAPPEKLEELLRLRLEGSGFFGARFRENAGRSLLLSKGKFNERKPLWMTRLQSQKLMESVMKYEDFPILLETWRTCLQDEFDLPNLRQLLYEIASGEISITEVETSSPSPFAQSQAWGQINTYMYMSDAPRSSKASNLRSDLLQEVVFTPGLRPGIPPAVIAEFEQHRQRLNRQYCPTDDEDLLDWIKERSLIPLDEWEHLASLLDFTAAASPSRIDNNAAVLIVATEDLPAFSKALGSPSNQDNETDFDTLLANWLQYYGPVPVSIISQKLGLTEQQLTGPLQNLIASEAVISGQLVDDDDTLYWCDAANYEYLLRILRSHARLKVEPEKLEALPMFLYAWQTQFSTSDPVDQTFETLERLRGLPLTPALWEAEILPSRQANYNTQSLDLLFAEGEMQWLGLGKNLVTFCFNDDVELLLDSDMDQVSDLLTDPHARYDFGALLDKTGSSVATLSEQLWQEVWQSLISNDMVAALRQGIGSKFRSNPLKDLSRSRRGLSRRRGSLPLTGNWYQVSSPSEELDPIAQHELEKDRVRLMLNRYGIVFRELCAREAPTFVWRALFRALRLMELSGEVVSGYFFEGIPGPQFMTPASIRCLQQHAKKSVFFINATDPISPCGLGLPIFDGQLPRRIPGNHLVFDGDSLVLKSTRNGKSLEFLTPPDCPSIGDYLDVLHHLCYRSFQPLKQLHIEEINGEPAVSSQYLECLDARFNIIRDYKSIIIQREL